MTASGELDLHSQGELRQTLREALRDEPSTGLSLDLRKVDFIDSAGVKLLSDLSRTLKEKQRKFVLKASPRVQKTVGVLVSAGLLSL